MQKPDWDEAPESATHLEPEGVCPKGWMKEEGGRWYYWGEASKAWISAWVTAEHDSARVATFIARPDNAPAWTGEGLPPVGTVCEVRNNALDEPEFERCTILFMGKFKCVYESESCHERVGDVSEPWILEFRPIRTPEQLAAEAREKAIEAMASL